MKKIAALCLLLTVCFNAARAVVVQKFSMKNGSVYYGFIVSQNTQGNMTISAERSKVCVSGKQAQILREYRQPEEKLSKEWVEWAQQNNAFIEENGVNNLCMADVSVTNNLNETQTYKNVCLIEKGYRVSFVSMDPSKFTIQWGDVLTIQAERRKRVELSGINVCYKLANGEQYEGQYAEETEHTLSLYDNQGMKRTFAIEEVVKCKSVAINNKQDFFEQCPTLDKVITREGQVFEGYIVEQVYERANNALTIKLMDGSLRTIKMDEVKETQRFENKGGYKPILDFIVEKDQFFIDRKPCKWTLMQENDNSVNISGETFKEACVKFDSSQVAEARCLNLEYNIKTWKTLPDLQLIELKKAENRKSVQLQFTYKNLAISSVRATKEETSVNGTVKVTYKVTKPGFYALYNPETRKALLIYVK